MLTDKLQQIDQQKSKLASLQQALLADLHSIVGFASRSELVQELQRLGGSRKKKAATRKARKTVKKKAAKAPVKKARKAVRKAPAKKAAAKKSAGRRKRAKITPQLRDDIIAAVKGGATGAAVAKQFGVSVPTVQNIKKAAGLTRKS